MSMKKITKILFMIMTMALLFYLALPNLKFPSPPDDSLQSDEPADTESNLRRAYFTNLTREEVMLHYEGQFTKSTLFNLTLPTYRLNYPPEEAKMLIRDQTRSTFLEEIVHPFRESVFVNGFEPKDPKDAILIGGRDWRQKIIIRYVPSNILVRLILGITALVLVVLVYRGWYRTVVDIREEASKKLGHF